MKLGENEYENNKVVYNYTCTEFYSGESKGVLREMRERERKREKKHYDDGEGEVISF